MYKIYINVSTKTVAAWSWGAGHGCKAGGGIETGGFSASSLAGLLNDINGVWLEGQTHIDLDDAARARDRRDSLKKQYLSIYVHSYNSQ